MAAKSGGQALLGNTASFWSACAAAPLWIFRPLAARVSAGRSGDPGAHPKRRSGARTPQPGENTVAPSL